MDDTAPPAGRLSGRKAEAARNDLRIREAARTVFLADPNAPISAIAKEAEVGIAALYRRYPSKEDLLRRIFLDSNQREIDAIQAALDDPGDPWTAFCRYAHESLDAGTGLLSLRVPVTFPIDDEWRRTTETLREVVTRLVDRNQAAGALRADFEIGDVGWLCLPVQAISIGNPVRVKQMRHRYLAIALDGLHTPSPTPLPGPAPGWYEFGERWEKVVPSPRIVDAYLGDFQEPAGPPLSGRKAEAARNDRRIVAAARAAFVSDPEASMATIAERAGVGIAAIYRRYPSKEDLARQLYLDGIEIVVAETNRAIADPDEPRRAFRRYAHRMLEAGMGSTVARFAGAFPFTPEIMHGVDRMTAALQQIMRQAQAAGALRPDVTDDDISWLYTPTYAIRVGDEERAAQLRHRFLALVLDGLQTPIPSPLPSLSPDGLGFDVYWNEMFARSEGRRVGGSEGRRETETAGRPVG